MAVVIKSKKVSYGTVEIVDNQSLSARYYIRVNGSVKEISEDLSVIRQIFNNNYY